jgi:non-ribosomal peptide synthetase component F
MTADDRVLAVTTLSFDISVAELFLPAECWSLRLPRRTAGWPLDALLLSEAISDMKITYMQATPPTWRMLLDDWMARTCRPADRVGRGDAHTGPCRGVVALLRGTVESLRPDRSHGLGDGPTA